MSDNKIENKEKFDEMDFMEGIDENNIPDMTIEEQEELKRRLNDFNDPIRYIVFNTYMPNASYLIDFNSLSLVEKKLALKDSCGFFSYNVEDSFTMNGWGTMFKREDCANAIAKVLSEESKANGKYTFVLFIAKINKESEYSIDNILDVKESV